MERLDIQVTADEVISAHLNGEPVDPTPFDPRVEELRRGEIVKGALGPLLVKSAFTMGEARARQLAGLPVPLDLLPHEFWHPEDLPFPRFGEEMLGSDF